MAETELTEIELTFEGVLSLITQDNGIPREDRKNEFYAIAQLLAAGILTSEQQKDLGAKTMKMLETDHWWEANGAFNDE